VDGQRDGVIDRSRKGAGSNESEEGIVPYMLLIVEPIGQRRERSDEVGRQLYERMLRFGDQLKARGLLLASQSLTSDADGVRVQVRDGKRSFVDGPFSESKGLGNANPKESRPCDS
jgi:hypothetical protein